MCKGYVIAVHLSFQMSSSESPMETIENGSLFGTINGNIIGGPKLVVGKKGLALQFNGNGQHVDFGDQGGTCLGYITSCTHGWVAAFWMQCDNTTRGSIVDTRGGVPANQGAVLHWKYGTLEVYFFKEHTFWELNDGGKVEQGWRHVVVTWCLYYGAKLYINGGLVATTTITFISNLVASGAPRFLLGADVEATSRAELSTFVGTLDEFRIWDMVMSDEEVWELYTADYQLI